MEKYNNTLQDEMGNIITTATVTVYNAGTGTVSSLLQDDEVTPLDNPFTLSSINYDSDGSFYFKAENGDYDIKSVNGVNTSWLYDETLFDFADASGSFSTPGIDDNATTVKLTIEDTDVLVGVPFNIGPTARTDLQFHVKDGSSACAFQDDGIGGAQLLLDGSDGDFSGDDYADFRHDGTDLVIRNYITDAITIDNSANTTIHGTLTITSGGSLTGTWSDLGAVTTVDINDGTFAGALDGSWSSSNGLEALTTAEIDQLENIGANTISSTQWGYVGDLNQGLTTTSNVSFGDITSSGDVSIADSKHYYAGTGDDLDIYHDGSSSYILNNTGTFVIREDVNSAQIQVFTNDSGGTSRLCLNIGGATPTTEFSYGGSLSTKIVANGWEVGTFDTGGSTDGKLISANQILDSSRDTNSDANHQTFWTPSGLAGLIKTNTATTTYQTTSDERLKTSHGLVIDPFKVLDKFDIHHASFNVDPDNIMMMVMAQAVDPHYPQATSYSEEYDLWSADYSQFSPLALACIKDVDSRLNLAMDTIKELSERIKVLEAKIQ